MSYILEALKKSDKKRQEGQVPDLHTIQIDTLSTGPKKRALWPYLLLAVLALNALVLTAFLYFRQPEKPLLIAQQTPEKQTDSTLVEPKQKPPEGKLPSTTPTMLTQNASPPIVIRDTPEDEPVSLSANTKTKASPKPAKTETRAPVGDPDKMVVASTAITEEPPVDQGDIDQQDQLLYADDSGAENPIEVQEESDFTEGPELPQAAINSEEQLAAPSSRFNRLQQPLDSTPASSQQAAAPPIQKREVLDLLQLPSFIQQDLPEFRIAAHVYSKKPASRLVSINKRVLREGHTLSPGLKVEEITTDGVIFSYKDYLFQVGVF